MTETNKCQKFVDGLRNEFLEESDCLAKAFLIDCSCEYDDCDADEEEEFRNVCKRSLLQVLENQEEAPEDFENFAENFANDIVDYMKTINDPAALPRCDAHCPKCRSLCIEPADHDTTLRPHDAIHQPGGIYVGIYSWSKRKLVHISCSQSCEMDGKFNPDTNSTVSRKYTEFAEVYPGWKVPRINEEIPIRQYILATYNKDIAKKYKLKPCSKIPSAYFRDLLTIREQLTRDTEG